MTRVDVSVHSDLDQAITVLRATGSSFVLVRDGQVLAQGEGHGVQVLLATLERLGAAQTAGAALADKVVGRAAVMAALRAGIRAIHGEFLSQAALAELERRGLLHSYGVLIPKVLNRRGDALCPFEEAVAQIDDPEEAVRALSATFERLQQTRLSSEQPSGPGGDGPTTAPQGSADKRAVSSARSGEEGRRGERPAPVFPARIVSEWGLWLGLSIGVPMAVHPLGVGPALLPMHIPVLLAGALSGPMAGLVVGALAPLLSHLLTGMPPMAPPIAVLMSFELGTYGLVSGSVRRAMLGKWQAVPWVREYVWLLAALVLGRVALGGAAALVGPAIGLTLEPVTYVAGAVLAGMPGVLVQLALVPALVSRLARWRGQVSR